MAKTKQKGTLDKASKKAAASVDGGEEFAPLQKYEGITSSAPLTPKIKAGVSPARKKLNAIIERKRAARGKN